VDANTGKVVNAINQSYNDHEEMKDELVGGTCSVFDPDPLTKARATYTTTGYDDGDDEETAQTSTNESLSRIAGSPVLVSTV
jgi:hypothetical protein